MGDMDIKKQGGPGACPPHPISTGVYPTFLSERAYSAEHLTPQLYLESSADIRFRNAQPRPEKAFFQ
jgi:hypothetical protein